MHKAASTSFQRLCFHHRKKLRKHGILYPKIDKSGAHFNHNYWIDNAHYDGDFSWCKDIVARALKRIGPSGCLILSAENFEYFTGDDFPERLVCSLQDAGASSVDWAFVFRNPADYHASIYSQFGAGRDPDRPILDFLGSAILAAKWGSLNISSFHQVHKFIFDYPAFLSSFSKRVDGKIVAIPFELMIGSGDQVPGDPLLAWLSGGQLSMTMLAGQSSKAKRFAHANRRLDPLEVEKLYARRFIGAVSGGKCREDLISEIASERLNYRYRSEPQAWKILSERFHNWQDVFIAYSVGCSGSAVPASR
jgi:hypothetical protein